MNPPFKAVTAFGNKIASLGNKALIFTEGAVIALMAYYQHAEHLYGGSLAFILTLCATLLAFHIANKILALACDALLTLIYGNSDTKAIAARKEAERRKEQAAQGQTAKQSPRYRTTRQYGYYANNRRRYYHPRNSSHAQ